MGKHPNLPLKPKDPLWFTVFADLVTRTLVAEGWTPGRNVFPPEPGFEPVKLPDYRGEGDQGYFLAVDLHNPDTIKETRQRRVMRIAETLTERGLAAFPACSTPQLTSRRVAWVLFRATEISEGTLLSPGIPKHLVDRVPPELLPKKSFLIDPQGELWEEDAP